MILRAIVQKVDAANPYSCKIKYVFDKNSRGINNYTDYTTANQNVSTDITDLANKELTVAAIATHRGVIPKILQGDCVLVSIEENFISQPIVVGVLFNNETTSSNALKKSKNVSDFIMNNLDVNGAATFNGDIDIPIIETGTGNVKRVNIEHLANLDRNVHESFGHLHSSLSALTEYLDTAKADFEEATPI